jgi:uncharacterized protein (TIGR00645 family)
MAPFYAGLVLALVALLYTFVQEIVHLFTHIHGADASDVILAALALIDLSLAGNLLLIVIFSGYESFVSKIDIGDHEDQFEWKGKVDFSAMKLKLIASIVAISGIHLLKVFMDIKKIYRTGNYLDGRYPCRVRAVGRDARADGSYRLRAENEALKMRYGLCDRVQGQGFLRGAAFVHRAANGRIER